MPRDDEHSIYLGLRVYVSSDGKAETSAEETDNVIEIIGRIGEVLTDDDDGDDQSSTDGEASLRGRSRSRGSSRSPWRR